MLLLLYQEKLLRYKILSFLTHDIIKRSFLIVSSSAIYSGWTTKPTRRSETARLQSITIEVERMEGVFQTAASTKELPMMEVSISAASIEHTVHDYEGFMSRRVVVAFVRVVNHINILEV